MALSLGVSVGDKIAVGDSVVEVRAIHAPKTMVVSVDSGAAITVSDNKAHPVEILPGVRTFVGVGPGKHSSGSRLAFEAPKTIPIRLLSEKNAVSAQPLASPELDIAPKPPDETALFINGVFEDTLLEILKNQKAHPGRHHYLQPYSTSRILLLAKSAPTPEKPVTLYFSVTKSLNLVLFRAKAVGWQDKRKLTNDDLAHLNEDIHKYQPSEENIYLEGQDGKPCVNLIHIVDLEKMEPSYPVSCLNKVTDGKPLKNRERAGGWVPVRPSPDWLGTLPQAVLEDVDKELAKRVGESLKDSAALRLKRLAAAQKLPEAIQVVSKVYRRNPDVIAEVLHRALGKCEGCLSPAPFERASDGSPYLEVHHRILLSQGGEDTVANAFALCPNCHRKLHFGKIDSPIEF